MVHIGCLVNFTCFSARHTPIIHGDARHVRVCLPPLVPLSLFAASTGPAYQLPGIQLRPAVRLMGRSCSGFAGLYVCSIASTTSRQWRLHVSSEAVPSSDVRPASLSDGTARFGLALAAAALALQEGRLRGRGEDVANSTCSGLVITLARSVWSLALGSSSGHPGSLLSPGSRVPCLHHERSSAWSAESVPCLGRILPLGDSDQY